ncbi:MAG: endonuclease/exonuclease/phosphatase family protein [Crocinitomicaceae bacterium]|nr:endonuclease/exonuclease/phosphatase family protein [Crocinitomicaceae bacterium]
MKANESKKLHWFWRIVLWLNILNSFLLIGAYINTHISPNDVSYLAFLGLGYPLLLLTALILMLVWLFIRWKLAFISIITILIGFNHFSHFYAFNFIQNDLKDPLKVLSYNVHIFDLYNLEGREENRNKIFEFLDKENADILCFQEFYHQQDRSFVTKDSLVELLNTPFYHERYTHELSGKRYFGVATFSKYPIINKGEIPFENDDNNYCIYSDLLMNEDTVRVFNAHIGSIRFQSDDYEFFGEENGPIYKDKDAGQRILGRLKQAFEKRAIQAEIVCAEIEKSPYPVILCGDLNDTPVSYCYRQFNNLLNDAFVSSGNGIGQTYIGAVPSNRIDYIFYDDQFESSDFVTHQVSYSDHKPISCYIGKVD